MQQVTLHMTPNKHESQIQERHEAKPTKSFAKEYLSKGHIPHLKIQICESQRRTKTFQGKNKAFYPLKEEYITQII